MAKTKISEFSSTPANNTDIDSINIAEGCAPSGINDAIRELMAQLKDFQTGAQGDSFNGPIGTSTAAAGAFTTLSASSTVTLSGGTANGVAYLNGSKVVTSGSALTFDGTNFGTTGNANLGSGSKSTDTQLNFLADTGTQRIYIERGSRSLVFYDVGAAIENYRIAGITGIQSWGVGGSEQMRLTSTGLGIGTSSPASKLHVDNGSGCRLYVGLSNNIYEQAYDHIWQTLSGASTKMTLDSSGNLGLGVTPNTWYSTFKAFQFGGNGSSLFGRSENNMAAIGSNVYVNAAGSNTYINTNTASYYQQLNGQHQWYNAPSGTAGNAISFTQAMTLDASGNLGVGTSSPTRKLDVYGSIQAADASGIQSVLWSQAVSGAGGIGTNNNYPFAFLTNGSERARIDSSGNLLVGTTSANGKFYVSSASGASSSNARFDLTGNSLTAANVYSVYTGTGNNNNNFKHFAAYSGDSGTEVFRVYGQGNVVNTNNSYGAISDIKLKENIVDATPKLANLMQVKVRNYNLIGDTTKQLGVVAQEIETIFPSLIDETPDRDLEGNYLGTTTKQVKYSVFVPMLIKAMQEQQAIIDLLKARLDAANL